MSRLDDVPEVADLAAALGLGPASRPAEAVVGHCLRRLEAWVKEAGGVADVAALEALAARRLQMVFEPVWSDEDFDRIKQKYATGQRDFVFATIRSKFDGGDNPTYGALVRRKNVRPDAPDRYVAVIDCRGVKAHRRFFTRWHEIAHRLTTDADPDEPVYRSEHDPIERLMDEIAGHVGFYSPLFDPAFQEAMRGRERLDFEAVEAVRSAAFPEASFQATLCACARRTPTPVVYLEAALGHKAAVRRLVEDESPRLFPVEGPPAQLRAVRVVANPAAQAEQFAIHQNMRVPAASVIRSLSEADDEREATAREDLAMWESQGRRLERRAVAVDARKAGDRVIAVVQPVEPVRQKDQRPHQKSLLDNLA